MCRILVPILSVLISTPFMRHLSSFPAGPRRPCGREFPDQEPESVDWQAPQPTAPQRDGGGTGQQDGIRALLARDRKYDAHYSATKAVA